MRLPVQSFGKGRRGGKWKKEGEKQSGIIVNHKEMIGKCKRTRRGGYGRRKREN
jgi:hypothetical protein